MPTPRSLNDLALRYSSFYLGLVILAVILGGGALVLWQRASAESLRLNSMVQEVEAMRGNLYRQMKELFDATFLDDPQAQTQYVAYGKVIEDRLRRLSDRAQSVEEVAAVRELKRTYREIHNRTDAIAFGPIPPEGRLLQRIFDTDLETGGLHDYEAAFEQIDRLFTLQQARLQQRLSALAYYAPLVMGIPILAAFCLLLLTHRFLQRSFVQPLSGLLNATTLLAGGNLRHAVPRHGARELVTLADAINGMASDLSQSRAALVLAERQATLGSLVPVVAHNIRNPLASIRATAQVIDDPGLPADVREGLAGILGSSDRLERWTESLLSYLHPLEAHRVGTDVALLLEDLISMAAPLALDRQVSLSLQADRSMPPLSIDPDLIEQGIYGLLVNALEASPAAGQVQVVLQSAEDRAEVLIQDSGPGMALAPKPGMLTPGPTTKRAGTGLGIPFALKVSEVHGGGLQFRVRPGGGTEALFWLPIA